MVVLISDPPSIPVLVPSSEKVLVKTNFTLNCTLSDVGYPPARTFSFRRKDGRILQDINQPVLTISHPYLETLTVKCYASSEKMNSPMSKVVIVRVEGNVVHWFILQTHQISLLRNNSCFLHRQTG